MRYTFEKFLGRSLRFPILTVDAIIKDQRGILLTKRAVPPCKGRWCLPGGKVECGERVGDAVKREVLEETGLKVKIKKFVGIFDDPKRDPRGHVISLCFLASIAGGKITISDEVLDVRFFRKIPRQLGFDHKKMLARAGVRV